MCNYLASPFLCLTTKDKPSPRKKNLKEKLNEVKRKAEFILIMQVFFHCFLACAVSFFDLKNTSAHEKTNPHMRESDEKMLALLV